MKRSLLTIDIMELKPYADGPNCKHAYLFMPLITSHSLNVFPDGPQQIFPFPDGQEVAFGFVEFMRVILRGHAQNKNTKWFS